ncbi:TPA: hypothetical protein L7126_004439 [Klebsiella pneumoniae]|uniref:hypothetical protein n=1 Tax=Klebsiella pneumoniae complex TaxID=3390273 RepID=UPI000D74398D|nr:MULTISPECIES: hypothetical protein [Klebsiella]PXH48160.1 hypothetical protein DMS67_13715 [Klebsiella variicola]TIH19750.1 hypothetical protein EWQ04_15475 [Klebsiella pneumoniae]HBQ4036848.1 hypothetical protein [Klebsiella pneumoniae]
MINYTDESTFLEKHKPFRKFWTILSPHYVSLLHALAKMIRGGNPIQELPSNDEDFLAGYETCLKNWKDTQKIISFEIIIRLRDIKRLEVEKKEHHRNKDKENKEKCIDEINLKKFEILILRRCIDSIIWSILDEDHSSLRRLPINAGNDNLSEDNIIDSMVAADLINQDKHAVAIVSDMSTFVHVGDLVTFNPLDGFQLVEVKTGEKNNELYEAAEFSVISECPHFEENFINNMPDNDVKQFNRIKRQIIRGMNVLEAINTGEGFDNLHQSKVKIDEIDHPSEFYTHRLVKMWEIIRGGKNWAIDTIDECLFLGMYRDSEMGFVAFNGWMDSLGIKSPVVNINDSFFDPLSRPFMSLHLPTEMLSDLMSGQIIIVMCFDNELFFHRANKTYPGLLLLSNAARTKQPLENILHVGSQGIASYVDGHTSFLGNGIESRILFDQQRPDNIIEWSYARSDLKKQHKA